MEDYDCTSGDTNERNPVVIEEIYPPSCRPLVAAIYSQDVGAVITLLEETSDLANSWVSLRASNYTVRHTSSAAAKMHDTTEPLLFFAATIHHYKSRYIYSRRTTGESIDIVRAIVDHGAKVPLISSSCEPIRGQKHNVCFKYGPEVQDCPDILELLIRAGLGATVICTGPAKELTPRGQTLVQCAARYNAAGSMGVLLDFFLARGFTLQDFLPDMYVAAAC